MDVSRIRALRGPNLWSRHTALEAIVFCAEAERDVGGLPGFETRLRERFPEIALLQPLPNGDVQSLAHVLEFATLGLQAQAGCPVTFSRTAPSVDAGIYQVIVEYGEEEVGRLALELACALCRSAADDTPFDLADALRRLRKLDEDVRLGPSTGAIVYAAVARGIPYRRLTRGSLVQFGWGSRQRRIQAAETDVTSAVAEAIAQDKELTKRLLRSAGLPVPAGRPVEDAEDAWAAAREIGIENGVAVVLKPRDGNQGKGVAVNLKTREQVLAAYAAARKISEEVLLEAYVGGQDHRLLIVGDKLVAAARREPPMLIGDGTSTVAQLIERLNADPRRGDGHATSLTRVRFDDIATARLAEEGLTAESIPAKGRRVILRNNANLSTGGSATDVTDDVHPELAARAVAAARMIGLDVAGVDVVCKNVLRPLEEQGGGIVEINAAPGLRMHLAPSFGKGRAVGEAIVAHLFADGDDARIPLVAIAGTNGKTTTARLIARLLGAQGKCVGMACTDGVYVRGRRIDTGDCSGPKSARKVLMRPDVDAAVLETARGGILREGLGFDRCDVAVITNIGKGDHLGLSYIRTVEDLAVVKRVIVRNVKPDTGYAVLNAADPMVAPMAESCPGKIIFFARDRGHPVMAMHRARGQRIVFLDDKDIVALEGATEWRIALDDIPITAGGAIGFQIENVMAAIGAGWALGLDWAILRAGLETFVNDVATAPGRFNLFDYEGATLIADYGHNPDAIAALVQAIEKMPGKSGGRRSVVISGAGDRRDEDIRQQTEILGEAFDTVVLYQDKCQRGRADGEVLALLRQGLGNARRARNIVEIRGEFLAIDTALADLKPGDLCLILIDQVEEALAHIARRCGVQKTEPA
ncbi:MAG: cyanophycin synthetase [Candidatus Accumulibacter sp.]|jgi:cyanophycin synthetase|nr:cyanophycin synthetase [Accumulibacter sp.]